MDQATEKKEYQQGGGTAVASVTAVRQRRGYLVVKRSFDIVFSLVLSLVLLIPMAIIAAVIAIKDPGNPFYIHKRIGKDGREISVLKFRSMRHGSDDLERMLTKEQLEEYKCEFKLRDDPRLLGYKKPGDGEKCFGALLRKSSLDELPQIPYNVLLKGNMSFVGPRPIMREELDKFYTREEQELFLSVKPGITGYWQTNGRSDCTYESGERQKLELYYAEHQGVGMDLKILLATVGVVVHRGGHVLKTCVREQWTDNGKCYLFVKRAFDIAASFLALAVLSPLFLVMSAVIYMDDPKGSPIFVQTRVGKNGKTFRFYKFRSMVVNAEELLDGLIQYNEVGGCAFKIEHDPRITRVGKFIRRTSIDELPQLVNVLRGDMSIVGPRPPLPREVEHYNAYQMQRLAVTPGLTCYWQTAHHRNDIDFDDRVALDLKYIQERSVWLDLKLIFRTFRVIFTRQGW